MNLQKRRSLTPYWKSRFYEPLKRCHNYNWETNAETTSENKAIPPLIWNRSSLPTTVNLCIYTTFQKFINQKFHLWLSEFQWFTMLSLAWFLHNTTSPVTGKSQSSVQNFKHFIQLLKLVSIQNTKILITFDAVNLFTNALVKEVTQSVGIGSTVIIHWDNKQSWGWKKLWSC